MADQQENNTNTGKDILIAGLSLLTSIITSIILVIIEKLLNLPFYTFMFWFVIPVGAIASGAVAASGYYFGAKRLSIKANKNILLNMIIASISTFFLTYYASYITQDINGYPVSNYISFIDYLDIRLTKAEYALSIDDVQTGISTGEVGAFGYFIGLLQIIGFAGGGWLVYNHLKEEAYCNKCKKYFKEVGQRSMYFIDSSTATDFYNRMIRYLFQNDVKRVYEDNNGKDMKDSKFSTSIHVKECPICKIKHVEYLALAFNGKEWRTLDDKTVRYYVHCNL